MASLDCREPGCGGDGMISSIYVNKSRKTFRWTSRCCPKCNNYHRNITTEVEGEELATFGTIESSLQAEGYTDVMEKLKTPVADFKKSATG